MATASVSKDPSHQTHAQRRATHFHVHLRRFQFREVAWIPDADIARIEGALRGAGMVDPSDATPLAVHRAMKDLRLREHYDKYAQATARITGNAAPRLTTAQEARVRSMFTAVSTVYGYCCGNRITFFPHPYVLFRLFQLCGFTNLLGRIPLPRGHGKLAACDRVWAVICLRLGWPALNRADCLPRVYGDLRDAA